MVTFPYCRNACRKLHDFSDHRQFEDAVSVDRIVSELKQETPTPVLLYKPQGRTDPEFPMLAEGTFLIVLMTNFQASLFEAFSDRITCLDSTHKTNQHRFKLLTIVVPDEYRNGKMSNLLLHVLLCTCTHEKPCTCTYYRPASCMGYFRQGGCRHT